MSRARSSLMGDGIIVTPARGKVMFNLPYLASYVVREPEANADVARARAWGL